MRTSQTPFLHVTCRIVEAAGWGFTSGSLAVCSILKMCCTRFCLPPPNQQASLPPEVTGQGFAQRHWSRIAVGTSGDRGSENAPIASLPNCRLQFVRRLPNHPPSRNTFLIPSCGVRRTSVCCASHPSYEVVWLSSSTRPALSPRREEGLLAGLAPSPQQPFEPSFTPPPGRPLSGQLRALKL